MQCQTGVDLRIATVNTKGGSGKTTSAVFLAVGLHQQGRTLLIDADPQSSSLLWSQQGEGFPFSTVSLPVNDLHKRLDELGKGYDHIVIDTPPGNLGIIRSAVLTVETVIVPVSPTGLDFNRMRPTFELLAELEAANPVDAGVLLTKVRRGTRSAGGARQVLDELGYPVLDTEIPLAELYAGSFGSVPVFLGAYEQLLDELSAVTQ
jgi:chromosome partitioning protein